MGGASANLHQRRCGVGVQRFQADDPELGRRWTAAEPQVGRQGTSGVQRVLSKRTLRAILAIFQSYWGDCM